MLCIRPVALLIVVVSFLLIFPAHVQAEQSFSSEVTEAAERGRELFDEGRYEEAIRFLLESYITHEEPMFFQYIGRCFQELEQYCQAAEYYRRFVDEANPPEDIQEQIETRITDFTHRCEQEPQEQQEQQEQPEPVTEPPDTQVIDEEEPVDQGPRRSDIVGYSLLGVGSGASAVAIILMGLALGERNTFDEMSDAGASQVQLLDQEEEIYRFSIPGDVLGFAVGLPLLVAGVVVYVIGRLRARTEDSASAFFSASGFHF